MTDRAQLSVNDEPMSDTRKIKLYSQDAHR